MDIGKVIKIHNIPNPNRREIRIPDYEPNRFLPEPEEKPIRIDNWPKVPAKVPEKVEA